ncbi:APC family permease [Gordonia terrae]|uniref:APC family permease n=2 Tax=Gordonia terrae TaxID=2055 RepID=A0AAD0NWD9_9ACTN|nr:MULTISPECIES: APC family permease [Gordonia]VTR09748.1 amino acid transporter [Clostridioides difficile]ANY22340.1 amino acid permease [Gordonia terrae]AWO83077.1 APC family permease [Gordonia terrae]VTS32452.1 Low-affinity putrescine importer PlaP [Gordonia terrae]GAB43161.1 putative amino acid transporter [Gordonia terrae NBRC 100016]
MTASTDAGATGQNAEKQPELKRVLGWKLLLLFIIGDILGTGVYALTGQVAGEVGGAAWLPFLIAFAVATLTAFSYLELVTKYPQAAGAALYVHKAFGVHFITFIVLFTVMCSGITSATTASRAFAVNMLAAFSGDKPDATSPALFAIAIGFLLLVMFINFRGVAEGVGTNVVLTLVELTGLLLVLFIGYWFMVGGNADHWDAVVAFESPDDKNVFIAVTAATSLAFFALVGFEDSVNMAEECKEPTRIFPKVMLSGLGITAVVYVLIAICAVAIVPVGVLAESETPLVDVVQTAAPDFPMSDLLPWISMFAVANTALINMMMASRLLYGMAKQGVLPKFLAYVHPGRRTPFAAIVFTTVIALCLLTYVSADPEGSIVGLLGGTTALLLLAVFTVVNVSVLVLRKDKVGHNHFRTYTPIAVLGAVTCGYLTLPITGRDPEQYVVAGWLLLLGIVLWALTYWWNKRSGAAATSAYDDIPPHEIP